MPNTMNRLVAATVGHREESSVKAANPGRAAARVAASAMKRRRGLFPMRPPRYSPPVVPTATMETGSANSAVPSPWTSCRNGGKKITTKPYMARAAKLVATRNQAKEERQARTRRAPSTSRVRGPVERGVHRHKARPHASITAPTTANASRQPAAAAASVTSGTPTTLLKPGWVVTTATPVARRSAGMTSPMSAIPVGSSIPPPSPARMRNPAALATSGASAVPMDAAAIRIVPATSTDRRPYASETGPASSAATAHAVAAAVASWATTGTVVRHSSAMTTSNGPSMAIAVSVTNTVHATVAHRTVGEPAARASGTSVVAEVCGMDMTGKGEATLSVRGMANNQPSALTGKWERG